MPSELARIRLLGKPLRKPPAPDDSAMLIVPGVLRPRIAAGGKRICLASPTALPLRTAAVDDVRIDRSVHGDDLVAAVRETSRVLAPDGRLTVETSLRVGTRGTWRRLVAAFLGTAGPPLPETVARLLLAAGFDRMEQDLAGSRGRFAARRMPGRPWSMISRDRS